MKPITTPSNSVKGEQQDVVGRAGPGKLLAWQHVIK